MYEPKPDLDFLKVSINGIVRLKILLVHRIIARIQPLLGGTRIKVRL